MISLNALHIESDPRLIFMCNSIENKGRANKSWTIKIVRDGYNDLKLNNIFSSRSGRVNKFDCTYTVQGITIEGVLIVTTITETYAEGVFTSGNGKLWESLQNKNLRAYDWTSWNHTLTKANVIASEAGGKYVYDLCDRGEWIQDNLIGISLPDALVDISERYPAMNIIEMVKLILNQEGYGLSVSSATGLTDILNAYLLFTGDKDVRNSADWLKSSLFDTEAITGTTYTDTGASGLSVPFAIQTELEFKTKNFDDGDNFNVTPGTTYIVPETGTYRFVSDYNLVFQKDTLATVSGTALTIAMQVNGTDVYKKTLTVPGGWAATFSQSGILDSKFIELQAADEVTIYIDFTGNISHSGSWTVSIEQIADNTFYNNVSRWYGAGSTVDFAKIAPDMTALEFISNVFNYLNVYTFYQHDTKILELRHGRVVTDSVDSVELLQINETIETDQNYWLRYNTDKAAKLLDQYIDNSGSEDSEISYQFSRTTTGACRRLFGETTSEIPLLWESSDLDPLDMRYRYSPPKYVTKGNHRILIYQGAVDVGANYDLTFGGDSTDNVDNLKSFPAFTEPDIESYHRYDLSLEGVTIKGIAKLPFTGLQDQSYFKSPIWIDDMGLFWLEEAEQIEGNIFNVTLHAAI